MGMFDSIGSLVSSAANAITPGVGSLLGAGLNYFGQQSTNEANAERADAANAWSAAQYGSRYQTMTKDLQAAGLIPMLAYSQSPGSAPTAQQVTVQNPASSATQGYQAIRGTEASATRDYASASQAEAFIKQIDATVDKIKEEIKNIPDEGKRIRQTVQMLADQAALFAQKGETEVQIRKQIGATVLKLKAETSLLNFDVDAAKLLDNLGRESKQLQPVVDVIRSILRK